MSSDIRSLIQKVVFSKPHGPMPTRWRRFPFCFFLPLARHQLIHCETTWELVHHDVAVYSLFRYLRLTTEDGQAELTWVTGYRPREAESLLARTADDHPSQH